jgi:hypothetical protein
MCLHTNIITGESMTDSNWTNEEEEAFNEVEKNSNLGKQILKEMIDTGQPYHWEADAIKAAVLIEREACARMCHQIAKEDGFEGGYAFRCFEAIRARNDTSSERVDINGERKHDN